MADRQYVVNRGSDSIALLVADVYEAAGALRRFGETTAAGEGQTQARSQLLSVVSERPLTVPQAARRLGISRQAVQRVADDVVEEGLVSFQPNPNTEVRPWSNSPNPAGRSSTTINERAQKNHRDLKRLLADPDIEIARQVLHALTDHAHGSATRDDRDAQKHGPPSTNTAKAEAQARKDRFLRTPVRMDRARPVTAARQQSRNRSEAYHRRPSSPSLMTVRCWHHRANKDNRQQPGALMNTE